jgi:NADPH:quinone reductase-like Zn-dependent oxidoreductase
VSATKADAQLITGALWNAGPRATSAFLMAPPICRVRQGGVLTTTSGVWSALTFNTTDVDSEGGHNNVTNNTRYTCQVPGWYMVEGYFAVNNGGGGVGRFACSLAKNGTQIQGAMQTTLVIADLQALLAGTVVSLAVGDYVETWGYQNTGSLVNTFVGTDLCSCMNVFWIHS